MELQDSVATRSEFIFRYGGRHDEDIYQQRKIIPNNQPEKKMQAERLETVDYYSSSSSASSQCRLLFADTSTSSLFLVNAGMKIIIKKWHSTMVGFPQ